MEIQFRNEAELYQRIRPALSIKVRELALPSLTEYLVWSYLKEKKWAKETGLSLAKMVHDILELDQEEIKSYLLEK